MKYLVRSLSVQIWPLGESVEELLNEQANELKAEVVAVHEGELSQTGSSGHKYYTVFYKRAE